MLFDMMSHALLRLLDWAASAKGIVNVALVLSEPRHVLGQRGIGT